MWLILLALTLVSAQTACSRDSYTSLPPLPGFPSTTFNGALPSPITQGHWSQVANLKNFRPPNAIDGTQTNCPFLATGLLDWHNAATWPSGIPLNNSNVNIPDGVSVLISSCSIPRSFVFGLVTIPTTSSLVFGDAAISFQAKGISVLGKLLMGSPTCRLRNKINITLHGRRDELPYGDPTIKGIHVTGAIDMHGVEYFPTWTRLASTAFASNQTIFIQDCPNWQPGQSIVITTTELKDSRDWHRNEEATIQSIQKTSITSVCAIQLDAPLQYTHYGGSMLFHFLFFF